MMVILTKLYEYNNITKFLKNSQLQFIRSYGNIFGDKKLNIHEILYEFVFLHTPQLHFLIILIAEQIVKINTATILSNISTRRFNPKIHSTW